MENFKKTLRREFMQMGGLPDKEIKEIVQKLRYFFGTAYFEVDNETGKSKTYTSTYTTEGLGFGYYPFNQHWDEFIIRKGKTTNDRTALENLKLLILNLLSGSWGGENSFYIGNVTKNVAVDLKIYDFIEENKKGNLDDIANEIAKYFGGDYENITSWNKYNNAAINEESIFTDTAPGNADDNKAGELLLDNGKPVFRPVLGKSNSTSDLEDGKKKKENTLLTSASTDILDLTTPIPASTTTPPITRSLSVGSTLPTGTPKAASTGSTTGTTPPIPKKLLVTGSTTGTTTIPIKIISYDDSKIVDKKLPKINKTLGVVNSKFENISSKIDKLKNSGPFIAKKDHDEAKKSIALILSILIYSFKKIKTLQDLKVSSDEMDKINNVNSILNKNVEKYYSLFKNFKSISNGTVLV